MNATRTSAARRPGGPPSRPPAGRGRWPVRERSLLRPVLGIPPLAATGLAVAATAIGVLVDLLRIGTVGPVFEVGYLVGCVLAVGWVRRRGIFLPAVQPPLLLAVIVPLTAVLIGAPTGGGAAQSVLLAGAPLINAFPAMAVTTLVVLVVAGLRLLRQRLGPDDAVGRLRVRMGRDPGGHDPDGVGRATAPGRTGPGRSAPGRTAPGRGRPDARGDPGGAGRGRSTAGGATGATRSWGSAGGSGTPGSGTPGSARSGRSPRDGTGRSGGTASGRTGRPTGSARTGGRSSDRGDTPGRARRATG